MKPKPLAIFAAAVLVLSSVEATSSPMNYTVLGAGNMSCGKWTKERSVYHSMVALGAVSWLQSYVTAVNAYAERFHCLAERDGSGAT